MVVGIWWCGPAVLAALFCAAGTAQAHPTAEVLDWGRMAGERASAAPPGEEGTGLAPALPMVRQRNIERTDAIEARLCRSFGLKLRILPGPGEPEPAVVRVRVLHPTFTGPGGATSAEDDFTSSVIFGQTYVGFTFDHPWEMRPGEWTIVVAAAGTVVAGKRFHVTLPPEGAPTTDCGGEVS